LIGGMTMRSTSCEVRLVSAIIAVAALAASASTVHAQIVFGANLNRPVNYAFDCGVGPGVGVFGEQVLYPTNVGDCTWLAIGTNFGQQESLLVPIGLGTVTGVRIKVGPITGPMQVVVLRALRTVAVDPTGANAACCFEMGRSAVFTPAPNAINTVAVNLPVLAEIGPALGSTLIAFDALGLSVLAPGVPIPAHDTGIYQDLAGPSALLFFPAFRPAAERADGFGTSGYQLLMDALWVPGIGGGGGGTTPAVVTLVQPVATRQGNFLLLGLRCNQATPCVGALTVQNQGVGGNGATLTTASTVKRVRPRTFAKAEFTIPPGETHQIPAKLTRKGKRTLRKSQLPTLYVNLRTQDAEGTLGTITIAPSS
jgi:hypothetical protein